jgi:cytochrome c oxidase cbb3-type subunit 3
VKGRRVVLAVLMLMPACGRTPVESPAIPPRQLLDFNLLYSENCAGCHGPDGKGGAAIALGDPVFLAIADDTIIHATVENGVAGTAMPAFAQKSGGALTSEQTGVIVSGMRSRWAKPDLLRDANPPPYTSQTPGDASRGAGVYETFCSSCHGLGGRGGSRASSIVDSSYLALVSDEYLRTIVIAGRPELGAPDWRSNVPGKPMTAEDVSDVVAWLAAQRVQQTSNKVAGGSR